jgi:hypothetical protein
MSRYEARITAFDVFDTVHITAQLWDTNGIDPAIDSADLIIVTTLRGYGTSEQREWLREALLGLLEEL